MGRVYKDAKEDAEELRDAMKGMGTDDTTLIEILCDRPDWQLQQISEAYESEFGKPLIKKIKSECRGNYESFLVGLLQKRTDYLVTTMKDAVEGLGTDERALIDCLCSATTDDIDAIKADSSTYQAVLDDVSGDFKKVIKSLFEADREEADKIPDLARACKDAKRFYRAGEGKFGTNDSKLIQIMTKRSNAHLQLVNRVYQKVYEKDMDDAIKGETRGAYEKALRGLLKPFDHYWAERLHKAMDGLGTDDEALIRCLLLCGKRRIPYVAAKYEELYGKSLDDAISGETSGDFKKAMLKFLKPAKANANLRNPLAAFQELSLDGVDMDGDVEAVEGPVDGARYILMSGGHEFREALTAIAKDGEENTFFLQFRDGKYLSMQKNRLLEAGAPLGCEEFRFEAHPQDSNKYAIKTHKGTYLQCDHGNGEWKDMGGAPGEYEQMELVEDFA